MISVGIAFAICTPWEISAPFLYNPWPSAPFLSSNVARTPQTPWRPQAHSVRSGAQSQLISVQISGGLLLRLRVLGPFQGDSRANLQRSQIRGTDSSPSRSRAKASLLENRVPLHQISVHIWGGRIQTSVELGCPQGGPGPNSWVLNQMVSRTHPFLRSSHVRTAGPRLQTGVLSCESGRTNPISSNLGTPQWLPGAFRR